ncbi:MFS transporter [Rhodovibrionaceae bacterium A322]
MYETEYKTDSLALDVPDWAAITAVVLGVTSFAIAQGLTYPLISLLLETRQVSEAMIGLNAAIFALGMGTTTLLIGPLTARLAGDHLILAALVGCSLCLLVFSLTDNLWIWFVVRFALGFCVSLVFMMSEAWLNVACPDRLRGRISGIYGAGLCGGFAAGPLAIPLFGSSSGFTFGLVSLYLAIVAFATALLCRRARTRPSPSTPGALRGFVKTAPLLLIIVLAFGFADIAAISVMPVYFVKLGYDEAFAALSVTALALPTALAQPLVGWFLDKFSRHLVSFWCAFVAAAAFLTVPFLNSQLALLVAFSVIGMATFALYTAALTQLGERFQGGLLVAGSAAFALAYAFGSAMGSTGTGAVMEWIGPTAAPISVGLVLVVLVFVIGLWRRPS